MARKKPAVLNRFAGRSYALTSKNKYEAEALVLGIEAFGGTASDKITDGTTHVVVAEGLGTKTTEKAIAAKSRKGLTILTVPADDLKLELLVDQEDAQALLSAGKAGTAALVRLWNEVYVWRDASVHLPKAAFQNADLKGQEAGYLRLVDQDATGLCAPGWGLQHPERSQLDRAELKGAHIWNPSQTSFRGADLREASVRGGDGCDFSDADLSKAEFALHHFQWGHFIPPVLHGAKLQGATISLHGVNGLDLSSCDARHSEWNNVHCEGLCLAGADLSGAKISGKMLSSDFTGAHFQNAELSWLDLTGSTLDGADFTGATLKKVTLPANLDQASIKGLDQAQPAPQQVGPALAALTAAAAGTHRLQIEWLADSESKPTGAPLAADKTGGTPVMVYHDRGPHTQYDWARVSSESYQFSQTTDLAESIDAARHMLQGAHHRFETVKVTISKSPLSNAKMTALVLPALAEALDQDLPPADELKANTKAYRAAVKAAKAASPTARRKEKAEAKAEKQRIERQPPEKPVTDLDSFMAALPERADPGRIKNATKMLKGAGFELFHDVTDKSVLGVIKSQSDASLVYACKLTSTGHFSCCTQNLNVCGGLRGALCKHQLVLVIGLVQTGTLDPSTAFDWIDMSLDETPALDKDEMADVLLKYKGAEAGEVDWRPTETVPEDFYAF